MRKAILIIDDMPCNCLECPFKYKSEEMPLGNFSYQSLFRCKFEPEDLCEDDGDVVYLNDIMKDSKPNWCQIKPVPQKRERDFVKEDYNGGYIHGFVGGWNACIDEIVGDKE